MKWDEFSNTELKELYHSLAVTKLEGEPRDGSTSTKLMLELKQQMQKRGIGKPEPTQ